MQCKGKSPFEGSCFLIHVHISASHSSTSSCYNDLSIGQCALSVQRLTYLGVTSTTRYDDIKEANKTNRKLRFPTRNTTERGGGSYHWVLVDSKSTITIGPLTQSPEMYMNE